MSKTHYEVPKKLVVTIISALMVVLISMIVFFEKKQDTDIKVTQQTLQTTMKELMQCDKAVGIIEKYNEGHKENASAHHTAN